MKFHSDFAIIGVLAENSRLSATSGILDAFSKLMSAHRGEVTCTITTAKVCRFEPVGIQETNKPDYFDFGLERCILVFKTKCV